MTLSEVKSALSQLQQISFQLPNGDFIPVHFHLTEVGKVSKHFIDCGGKVRQEERANFQLWSANDLDHRLSAEKMKNIIDLSEKVLKLGDLEIEVEYQADTIGKFGLEFNGTNFLLTKTQTDCLAKDKCGIPTAKPRVKLADLNKHTACAPNSGCC
ncbi:MAG: hypothetical protein CMO34_04775 [Verrucomicrobia bacterium]|nr:hypothetical protein [Verrucomicrobiota bacterium]